MSSLYDPFYMIFPLYMCGFLDLIRKKNMASSIQCGEKTPKVNLFSLWNLKISTHMNHHNMYSLSLSFIFIIP